MRRKTKTILGYLLIIFGIFIPLIGFFGMSYTNLTAKEDYKSFKSDLNNVSSDLVSTLESEVLAYNENIKKQNNTTIVDPFTANGFETDYNIENIGNGGVFAYLLVPKLDMVKPVYLDATYEHLDLGVAHIDGTNLPIGGEGTRSVIAGHRGWYNDTMFLNIDELLAGDMVYVDRGSEVLAYEVKDKEVIGPSDWDRLAPRSDDDILTLLTCEPFAPPRPYRLLINCERVEDNQVQDVNLENPDKIETDLLLSVSNSNTPSRTKYINYGIYIITGLLIIALVVMIIRFVVYLVKRRS